MPIDPQTGLPTPNSFFGQLGQRFGLNSSPVEDLASQTSIPGFIPGAFADAPSGFMGGVGNLFSGNWGSFTGPAKLGGTGEASIGSMAVPALAGWGASKLISGALPSTGQAGNVREALADAATGAGIGATLGTVFPGVGNVVGGVAGGIAGGAYGLAQDIFGGGDNQPSSSDVRKTLGDAATAAGLTGSDYTNQFDLISKLGMTDPKTGKKLDNTGIANLLGNQIINDAQQKKVLDYQNQQTMAQHQADLKFGLAMQTQARDFFSPYTNNIVSAGAAQAQVLNNLANSVPGPYKSVFQAQAASALNTSQQLAGAYAAQVSLMPGQYAQSSYSQSQADALKAQQSLVAMQNQQPSSGGVNFASLAQTPAASPTG